MTKTVCAGPRPGLPTWRGRSLLALPVPVEILMVTPQLRRIAFNKIQWAEH